jgi:hypothetical protein
MASLVCCDVVGYGQWLRCQHPKQQHHNITKACSYKILRNTLGALYKSLCWLGFVESVGSAVQNLPAPLARGRE